MHFIDEPSVLEIECERLSKEPPQDIFEESSAAFK